jgi:D-alanyl-D-alanine carboxypeptidase/D-alanyl-D-alanine-endopeptidase (penicillin-binding protein 4)
VSITPGGAVGSLANVLPLAPAGVVPVIARVNTAPAGADARTSSSRGPWSDTLRVTGVVAIDAEPRSMRLPMTDPVRFAAHSLADALRTRGITIDGDVRIVYDAEESSAIRAGQLDSSAALAVDELTAWQSPTMGEIVAAILGPSQNWIAEQLVRTLGAERDDGGSWRNGIQVQYSFLHGPVGIDSTALRLNDGSGMSHQNLVTPHGIVQLLDYARTAPWAPVFRAALAKPASPGTLNNRLRSLEGRLEGKTGTLNSVNALSGYVRTRDGRELIFSIISNASALPGKTVVSAIDRLVGALADGYVPR